MKIPTGGMDEKRSLKTYSMNTNNVFNKLTLPLLTRDNSSQS